VIERDESGAIRVLRDLKSVNIPGSIQGIVMARIDKLAQALKDVLQVAATIGPVFRYELIRRIFKGKNVEQRLNQLCDLEILFESRTFPEIEYSFRNVLIQEAVYSTMLHKKARELHQSVAHAIEALDSDRLELLSESLAHHWLCAGDIARAVTYLISGGLRAKHAFANDEAAVQLHQAIELAGQETSKVEIDLQPVWQALSEVLDLAGDLAGARHAAEKLVALITDKRAKADAIRQVGRLCEKAGDRPGAALHYGEALELLSDQQQSPEYAKVLLNQSWLSSRDKNYDGAIAQATQALGIFTAAGLNDQIALTYNNLGVFYEGLGDLDKALDYNRRSLTLFDELGDRRQIGNLHLSLGFVLSKRKDWNEALEHFDKAQETMARIGNRLGAATVLGNRAACLTALGRLSEAEVSLRQALQSARDLDLPRRVVGAEVQLAEHLARHGDPAEARKLAEKALSSAGGLGLKQDQSRAEHLLSLLAAPSN
jgi:tetratricopeptide (TPR) repeat protein